LHCRQNRSYRVPREFFWRRARQIGQLPDRFRAACFDDRDDCFGATPAISAMALRRNLRAESCFWKRVGFFECSSFLCLFVMRLAMAASFGTGSDFSTWQHTISLAITSASQALSCRNNSGGTAWLVQQCIALRHEFTERLTRWAIQFGLLNSEPCPERHCWASQTVAPNASDLRRCQRRLCMQYQSHVLTRHPDSPTTPSTV
jgi:hypothetical protein